ncbi:MAG: (2Fe-2S)-binding protein [Chloroflexi bacterium]|nr:(2Fe-2S)-binding protein [Chloroflexota bacterium]
MTSTAVTAPKPATSPLVLVNGVGVQYREGGRVLGALREAGYKVPTLCYDERVGPVGTCRMCLVEVEVDGRKQVVASCTAFQQAGMKVATHSADLRAYRQTLLEMLLSETPPPSECPKCQSFATCEFHSAVYEYEAKYDRLPSLRRRSKAADANPFIQRDYDFCIACYRCTNICNDWERASAITVDGRGQGSRIFSFFDNELLKSPCTFCGQCINTCPTGALTDRKIVGKTVASKVTRTRTICPYCGVGCGIHLLTQDGELVGAEPDFSAPSRGSLCVKGQFGSWEFVRSEERLKYPLIRRGGKSGTLERASWDEALDLITGKFKQVIAESGPDSITCWCSARCVNEANYLLQKFTRTAIGTNNVDNCSRT